MEREGGGATLRDALADYDLRGFEVVARDGTVGKVDEATYEERATDHLIVDVGSFLGGKKVLLPAQVVSRIDVERRAVLADVNEDDVKNGPEYEPGRRLDDDLRAQVGRHYGVESERFPERERAGASATTGASVGDGVERIRTEGIVENTTHNLIQTLSVKLDSAARYELYRDDARADGREDCVEVFLRLAERERESIRDLLGCLEANLRATGEARQETARERPTTAR